MEPKRTYLLEAPRLGEGLYEVRIVALLKQPGETVREDEPLYTLESDKATVSIESPHRGVLRAWRVAEGDVIRIGAPVAELEILPGAESTPGGPVPVVDPESAGSEMKPVLAGGFIPPRTRAHARKLGLSAEALSAIPTHGRRLSTADLDASLRARAALPPAGVVERELSPRQRALVYRMRRSEGLVVPCTMVARVRMDGLARHASLMLERDGADSARYFVSNFQMVAYAVAQVVKTSPLFRSQILSDRAFREHEHLNLGIAVHARSEELLTALIPRADTLSFREFVERFQERVEAAAEGGDQATESMQLVLSGLGESVVIGGTPLLVAPAVAVLSYSEQASDEPSRWATLSLTFDHRLIQGMHATRFLGELSRQLDEMRATRIADPMAHSAMGGAAASRAVDAGAGCQRVLSLAAALLGVPVAHLSPGESLGMQGIDSLKSVTLIQQLGAILHEDLPVTLLWRHPSASALGCFLEAQFPGRLETEFSTGATVSPSAPCVGPTALNAATPGGGLVGEPMAIVGVAFRFPGGVSTLDQFWTLMARGGSAVGPLPAGRFPQEPVADPAWRAGFLDSVDRFDAEFFQVSPHEAGRMDPQQRLFLETVWHAMEDAGETPERLAGSKTGVFAAVSNQDYLGLHKLHGVHDAHGAIGIAPSLLANRISYWLDLRGPSQTIDTACSGSLVALHQAMQSLRSGECDQAFVGGANLFLSLDCFQSFRDAGMLAPDGRNKTFDASADGYVRGEGVAALLIKPISAARRDGNVIHGLLLGSAVNHGGRAASLTAPNPAAQTDLVLAALRSAAVSAASIGYVEAHGTGTKLGDPIEVEALRAAFESDGGSAGGVSCCALGSVKPNLGHLEAVAGLAGVIKVLACLQHRQLPPSAQLETVNPHIRLENGPFRLLRQTTEWCALREASGAQLPRRAGVSSFGFGGANAHVVMQEPPADSGALPRDVGEPRRPRLLVLSAKRADALASVAQQLREFLVLHPTADLGSVAWTLQSGRAAFRFRLAVVVETVSELVAHLSELGSDRFRDSVFRGEAPMRPEVGTAAPDSAPARNAAAWSAVAREWVAGARVDWAKLWGGEVPRKCSLPGYPFAGDSHWLPRLEPAVTAQSNSLNLDASADAGELIVLHPRWDVVTPEWHSLPDLSGDGIRVIGGQDSDWECIQKRCPMARRLQVASTSSRDEIASAFQNAGDVRHVVWIAPVDEPGSGAPQNSAELGLVQLFRTIQAVLQSAKDGSDFKWTVVTRGAESVSLAEINQPTHAGVHGLAGTLSQEYPEWCVTVVDVGASDALPIEALLSLPDRKEGHPWLYRHGEWFRRQLIPVAGAEDSRTVVPYRDGGVYVVIGGAGGLGALWSEWLIRRHAARILWVGRRVLDARIQGRLEALGTLGPRPEYRQADVGDEAALRRVLDDVRRNWGPIHGVVHSAVGSMDQGLASMDEGQFSAGFAAKVAGAKTLVRLLQNEPLDFLVFFSSMAAVTNDHGKGAYAAGCTFQDALARAVAQTSSYPVKTVDWGYWGAVGIGDAIPNSVKNRLHQSGIRSIGEDEGMRSLEHFLSGSLDRCVVLRATSSASLQGSVLRGSRLRRATLGGPGAAYIGEPCSLLGPDPRRVRHSLNQLDAVLADRLVESLHRGGFLSLEWTPLETLRARLADPVRHGRWLEQVLVELRARGRVEIAGECVRRIGTPSSVSAGANDEGGLVGTETGAGAWLELSERTLGALSDILAGRRAATEVLFADASTSAVEAIYSGNGVADSFNAVVSDLALRYARALEQRDPSSRIRILEIGAGTGATSRRVFERFAQEGVPLAEYCFTDISRAFLSQAETRFRGIAPYLRCVVWDVESPAIESEIQPGSYDVVIASNVLHATRDIRRTLRHAKAALREGGVLLINEISGRTLPALLTFGLLDGWWLAEDPAVRIPGCPGLFPDAWGRVLAAEGYRGIAFPVTHAHALGQQILLAESDGWIREDETREPDKARKTVAIRRVPEPKQFLESADPTAPAHPGDNPSLRSAAMAYFRSVLSESLKVPVQRLDPTEPLETYGIDSILVMQLVARLRKEFPGIKSTLFFEVQTLQGLVEHFLANDSVRLASVLGIAPRSEFGPENKTHAVPKTGQSAVPEAAEAGGTDDAIAIIGMSGAFPMAPDLAAFWEVLRSARSCISEVPEERWSLDGFYEPDRPKALREGKSYSKFGGWLSGFADFDPLFFNISPVEAEAMDPQERLFLEHSWRAMEDAGYTREVLATRCRGRVGVFTGITSQAFALHAPAFWNQPEPMYGPHSLSSAPNRVSYVLNLHGPSMPVDTMCSSSLTALHLACEHLRRKECEMAIAGGVHLNLHPASYVAMCAKGMLSPSGLCHSFGRGADGFVPGEGVGVLILKPLSRALADGDPIRAIVRGSHVNHGGKTNGYTVPNPKAQQELVSEALRKAGTPAESISCLEAHGTGTELGDPIEVSALAAAFGAPAAGAPYCALGSVKSNLGHLEAAAGIAGVIKVILQLQHRILVPTLHAEELNPEIELAQTPFRLQREVAPWAVPDPAIARRAGVSSFGAGGANAHVILEEFAGEVPAESGAPGPFLVLLSARVPEALHQAAQNLLAYAEGGEGFGRASLADVAYTLQVGREAMEERWGCVVQSWDDLRQTLKGHLAGEQDLPNVVNGRGEERHEIARWLGDDDEVLAAVARLVSQRKHSRLLELWARGVRIDWQSLHTPEAPKVRRVHLPTYAFARRRFWLPGEPRTRTPRDSRPSQPLASVREPRTPALPKELGYLLRWERMAAVGNPQPTGPIRDALVVSFEGDTPFLNCGVRHLQRLGARRVVVAQIGARTEPIGPDRWRLAGVDSTEVATWLASQTEFDCLVFLGGGPVRTEPDARESQELVFFRLIKGLQERLGVSRVDVFVLTRNALPVTSRPHALESGAGLNGLACSLAQSDRRFQVRGIDLFTGDVLDPGQHEWLWHRVLSQNPSDRGQVVRIEAGRAWRPVVLPLVESGGEERVRGSSDGFRTGGVYVIVGGAGTVGRIVTRRLMERYDAEVVWIGRSPISDSKIAEKMKAHRWGGRSPVYVQCDVTARDSMQQVVAGLKARFGALHGAFFSAVVYTENNSIEASTEEEFTRIFNTKTLGTAVFLECFRNECVDFVCAFSSIQAFAFTSSRESAGYAAGITAADAQIRAAVAGQGAVPVGLIHWGYWRAFIETTSIAARLKDRFGLIDDEEGFEFLNWFVIQLRAGHLTEAVCVRASKAVQTLMRGGGPEERITLCDGARGPALSALRVDPAWQIEADRLAGLSRAKEFEQFLEGRLRAALDRISGFDASDPGRRPTSVSDRYARWWEECVAMLDRRGPGTETPETGNTEWSTVRERFGQDPTLAARIPLVEACLHQLPEILSGALEPAAVLFPRGSMEQVEGVYQRNPLADFFNDVVAALVRQCVDLRRAEAPDRPVRLFEIGAGTGGTTARVLRQVSVDGRAVDYVYTDLSKAFLLFAEERYAPGNAGLSTRLFDAEVSPMQQGISPGGFDVVIATNVLHATRDLRQTLRHAKSLLSRNGILLLNEVTSKTWFQFLTFGLLEGWWVFEDPELRIPGSPVLDRTAWWRVLEEEGFAVRCGLEAAGDRLGQEVFLAESDGLLRWESQPNPKQAPSIVAPRPPTNGAVSGVPEIDGWASVEKAVSEALCQTLRLTTADLKPDLSFADYGIDSILTGALLDRVNAALGLSLNATVLFDHCTVARLSRHISENFRPAPPRALPSERPKTLECGDSRVPNSCEPRSTESCVRSDAGVDPLSARERRTADIAVIGMSGQFPGAPDVERFWKNLIQGIDVIRELPEHYLPSNQHSRGEKRKGMASSNRGGILEDRDCFDPLFFKISPREAESMNPHQRLVMQEGWRALEDAAVDPRSLTGQPVGVFVGAESAGYWHETLSGYSDAIVASRLSYLLNLTGPAFVVNTGCSSSGVALHQACRSLREGECTLALAGGVFAVMNPQLLVAMSQIEMLSRSGVCSTFDQAADGTVLSEGVGMVVLKRLEDAVRDGDPIHGVIVGSGVNQDGASNGITAPNGDAQERLIGEVYDRYGIDPAGITYIEAHGTGTKLGDPVEGNALVRAFRRFTPNQDFCVVGSAKSNVGHTAASAAVIGLIKILLSMRHRTLPGMLHYRERNPLIEFEGSAFRVGARTTPWMPLGNEPRTAGLNAFGHSGTNVHLVVQEPAPASRAVGSVLWRGKPPGKDNPMLVPLSARTPESLAEVARRLAVFLRDPELGPDAEPLRIEDVAWTLQVGREAMERRAIFVVADLAALVGVLETWRPESDAVMGAGDVDPQLSQPARAWSTGAPISWREFYGDALPRRRHLPTYRFARERYWKPLSESSKIVPSPAAVVKAATQETHPYRVPVVLRGDEAWLVDHRIHGDLLVPGVVQIEWARAAITRAALGTEAGFTPLTLENVVWLRPQGAPGSDLTVWVDIAGGGDSSYAFELKSSSTGSEPTLHCIGTGRLSVEVEPSTDSVSTAPILGTSEGLDATSCYRRFAERGIDYGPTYRVIQRLVSTPEGAIIQLRSSVASAFDASMSLDPGLFDGGLQGCLGIAEASVRVGLPFAVDSVEVRAPLSVEATAVLRVAPSGLRSAEVSKLDIEWRNGLGDVAVRMRGFQVRSRIGVDGISSERESVVLVPKWRPLETAVSQPFLPAARSLVLVELVGVTVDAIVAGVPDAQCIVFQTPAASMTERVALYGFRLLVEIRQLLARAGTGEVWMQVLVPGSGQASLFTGMHAMLLSAQRENPRFHGQLIEVSNAADPESICRWIGEGKERPQESRIRGEGPSLAARRWIEADMPRGFVPRWNLRSGGVYLITGGAGGIGLLVARHLMESGAAPTVVLAGRSPRDTVLARLPSFPTGSLSYREVDLTDRPSVDRLIEGVLAEHGRLDGIMHAAGVLRDGLMGRKTEGELREVVSVKVNGAIHLDEATRNCGLQFFVLFSSMSAVIGGVGQSDYAFANACLDQWSSLRQEEVRRGGRSGTTVAINWPLWSEGGMRVDSSAIRRYRDEFGVVPLETQVAMRGLSLALTLEGGDTQAWILQGEVPRIRATLLKAPDAMVISGVRAGPPPQETGSNAAFLLKTADQLRRLLASVLKLPPLRIEAEVSWEHYGIDSVMAMDLTFRLEEEFGTLPKTLFFEYQTLRSLAEYFAETQRTRLESVMGTTVNPSRHDAAERLPKGTIFAPPPILPVESGLGSDGIAIIGVAGRYPKAENLEQFWENLKQGRDCIGEVPSNRWDHAQFFDPDPNVPGKTYTRWGGFLDGIDEFDPLFFNISPREAAMLDPQERLFLQCAYHTAEDAGYTRESIGGASGGGPDRRVGVFVGVMYEEYQLYGAQETAMGRPMALTGSPASIANRVSYFFDLHGPSLAVDSMCSSSLSAIHLACQSLQRGECRMAFAGGVNLSVHPNKYLMLAQGRFASSKGRCESFGEGAEGYVPGEGVGSVLLKPLASAIADGDRIYGVIRGTAINHGGHTHGYTVPNPVAQARVIQQALEVARVSPRSLGYLEAHGTGTSLGDPIEIAGLSRAFSTGTEDRQFCALGSVKSNIGHGESAAGIAALTKVLLQLKNRQIVPSLHSRVLNPRIDFSQTPFVVQQSLAAWLSTDGCPLRAGVSSFGAGGGNAHLIVEEAPAEPARANPPDEGAALIVLSARDPEALRRVSKRLVDHLQHVGMALGDLAWTLQVAREAMEERLAFPADSLAQVRETLSRFANGESDLPGVFTGNTRQHRETITALSRDEDMAQTVAAWLRKGRVERVLELWVQGLEVSWGTLASRPWLRRIGLPGYPFARERCWFTDLVRPPDRTETRPVPGFEIPREQAEEARRALVYLTREWEVVDLRKGSELPGMCLILTSVETMPLAHRVQERIPGSRIVAVETLSAVKSAGLDSGDAGTVCIDLVGVGVTCRDEAEWIPWLQHLVERGARSELRLLGVTCGLQALKNAPIHSAGSMRAALYRMLQSEYARVRSSHLDLDPAEDIQSQAACIAECLIAEDFGPEWVRRSGSYHRPVLREHSPRVTGTPGLPWRGDRVLWITGGTRGLGALCARHFVRNHGVRRVVLTGVEALPPRADWAALRALSIPTGERIRNIEALEALGAEVRVLALQLGDKPRVRQALDEVVQSWGSIGGVIHCAGVSDSSTPAWIRKSVSSIQAVLAPKVSGVDVLLEVLGREPLQFLVLFSSVSAAIPSLAVGLSDYSMANAYLDCMAEMRAGDLPALSIQWPAWSETGAAAGMAGASRYLELGFLNQTDAEGLESLDQLLFAGVRGVVMAARVDPSRWKPEKLLRAPTAIPTFTQARPMTGISTAAVSGSSGLESVRVWLRGLFAAELQLDPARIHAGTSFAEYGADSVMLAQILRLVNQRVGQDLDPSLLLEHSTLDSLSAWLVRHHGDRLQQPPSVPTVATPPEAAAVGPGVVKGAPSLVTARRADLAVIGMSCRFPGAEGLDAYWELLRTGRKAIAYAPASRWGGDSRFVAGLLEDVVSFDPEAFLIADADARAMDPQAFLLLEETLRTVCHAGYSVDELKRRPIGVFVGGRALQTPDPKRLAAAKNPIRVAGANYLAANVSQFFDWQGPSLVVDTACSSALVAMQMAAQSLVAGDISAALVGGVSLLDSDKSHRLFEARGILAKTPEFHLFDARAGGMVPAEGVGTVLLKTLAQAIADGDQIHAVIRGIAVNNDGRTAGPATPNLEAQKAVMLSALGRSGRRPEEIRYIEVNGSGSEVTDLLELKAIQSVYGASDRPPCWLGSLKPNLGHPLCAEGIAGLIKTVLMLKHGCSVPFLSGEQPMRHFDLGSTPFQFPRSALIWDGEPRVAALNCFADGGTNVHVILESFSPGIAGNGVRVSKAAPVFQRRRIGGNVEEVRAPDVQPGQVSPLRPVAEPDREFIPGMATTRSNRWRQRR